MSQNKPLTNKNPLSIPGVMFTPAQTEQIRECIKRGDIVGAQRIILKILAKQLDNK